MRYVSPSGRLVSPEDAFRDSPQVLLWDRVRESIGGGRFWSAVLVILLTITVARSTATVRWVDNIDVILWVALAGALKMGGPTRPPGRGPHSPGIRLVLPPAAGVVGV